MQFDLKAAVLVLATTIVGTATAAPASFLSPSGYNKTEGPNNQTSGSGSVQAFAKQPSAPIPVFPKNSNGDGYCTQAAIANSDYPSGCAVAFWYPWNIKHTQPAEVAGTVYVYNNECSLLGLKNGAEGKFKYRPKPLTEDLTVFDANPKHLSFKYGHGHILGSSLSCGQFKNNENGDGFGWLCAFDCSS